MVVRDGFSRTLGQEPGVGLAVVADHDRATPQMNDFDGMGVAGHGRRMVVVPRCAAAAVHAATKAARSSAVYPCMSPP